MASATFATKKIRVSATYTEVAPLTPGSVSSTWDFWVVDAATATMYAAADAMLLEQFKSMRTGGRSVTITGHAVVDTRPNQPLEP